MSELTWPTDGRHLFIGGDWVETEAPPMACVSPIDGATVGAVPAAGSREVDLAVNRITPALEGWAAMSAHERSGYLREFARQIRVHAAVLAPLDTLDAGLLAPISAGAVAQVADDLDFHAGLATEIQGTTYPSEAGRLVFTVREPFGIVARIIPFNLPFRFAVKAAAPALVAGNAVVLKPSEHTSLSSLALAAIAKEVFPPGVLNVITGTGREAGEALVDHPAIARVACTGSAATGRAILERAAAHIKSVTLELGGKNPLVVAADADPAVAAEVAFQAMYFPMAGQACQSSTRALIHRSLYDEVVERLRAKMAALVVGDPREKATQVGPLAFAAHHARVRSYVRSGEEEGATLLTGGGVPAGLEAGCFLEPTLFGEVTPKMRIYREEIFGPVVDAIPYDDGEDIAALANDTEYGLYGRVVSSSLEGALRLARKVRAGTILVNTAGSTPQGFPFGGYKASGLGKQNCLEEILSYTLEKGMVVAL